MEMWSYKRKLLEAKLKTVQALPATRFNKAIFRLFDDCARACHCAAWQFKAASHTDNEEAKALYLKAADAYLEQVAALKKDDFVNARKTRSPLINLLLKQSVLSHLSFLNSTLL